MQPGGKRDSRPHGSHLLGKFFGKLRGIDHHKLDVSDKISFTTILSESTGSESIKFEDQEDANTPQNADDAGPNIDLRYGGQCLTLEQLPEFCDQLHRLVDVIRNIQSYAKVTGEYPSELERRLEEEAREVASLAAEVRNARDVVARTRVQRRAVRAQRRQLVAHLTCLRDTETRELESTVRLSDRKLYRSWESLKDSTDPTLFEPLVEEIRNKQTALDCLLRLIEYKQASLTKTYTPTPLPPPSNITEQNTVNTRKRHDLVRRSAYKRRRRDNNREPRSVPLSNEPSQHSPNPALESSSRYRVGSAGAVTLTPYELPSRNSVRDIVFFTTT